MTASVLDLSMVPNGGIKAAPKLTGIKPLGSSLLVELLTKQELTSSQIIVDGETAEGPPQAYVLAVGPKSADEVKELVGKRVLLNGTGTFVPKHDEGKRTKLLVDYHVVKAVLEEESPIKVSTKSGCCCR